MGTYAEPSPTSPHREQPLLRKETLEEIARLKAARSPSRVYETSKRLLDFIAGWVLLLLAAVPIAVISILIRLDSPGPAMFRQQRAGEDGRVFTFYKFRTMYSDARERFPDLYDYEFDSAEAFKAGYYKPDDDPRLTRFGRIVRKTSLDELPNLINVVKDDISLVGPRPELPDYVRYYRPDELVKFTVKAGMTGLAQVSGRNLLTVQEQIDADVEYVNRRSFTYDLRLLGVTVWMVIRRVGAV